jgi:hypothetical protein
MLGFPEWAWGVVGGLALGPIGLLILWPGCSRGAQALLTRFVVSVLVKLLLAGIGFWVVIKFLHLNAPELVLGFMGGYFISLFLEIIPCIWKVRRCANQATQAD